MSLSVILQAFSAQELSTGLFGSRLPSNLLDLEDESLPESFVESYLIGNLLKKTERVAPQFDNRSKEALEKFLLRERKNEIYNQNFDLLFSSPRMQRFMIEWKKQVHLIFRGTRPQKLGRVTSGATTTSSTGCNAFDRFIDTEATDQLADFLQSEEGMLVWKPAFVYKRTPGSKLLLVPKDFNSFRLVNPEPGMNVYYQCGAGSEMATLLKKVGIDLRTGQSLHQFLANYASITGEYATADLSNASWGIYNALCSFLTPKVWYDWLTIIRSPATYIDTNVLVPYYHELQQFATMGNGFCFEYETIIFLSALRAIAVLNNLPVTEVYVYGDDLIYPTCMHSDVMEFFKKSGFDVNEGKTFATGRFRESCGADFYNGHNIRPLYFKKYLFANPYELTMMANQIFDWLEEKSYSPRLVALRLSLIRSIPVADRVWGPPAMGDSVLKTHLKHRWKVRQRSKYDLPRIKGFRLKYKEGQSLEGLLRLRDPSKLDLYQSLALQGHLSGWGERVIYTRSEGDNSLKEERKYIVHPKSVGGFTPQKQWCTYFSHSNGVNETNPLSIFEVLPKTGCPARLYAKDYFRSYNEDKALKLSVLLRTLTQYLGARTYQQSFSGYSREDMLADLG